MTMSKIARLALIRGNREAKEGPMNSMHLIGRLAADVGVNEVNGWSRVSSLVRPWTAM